MFKSLSLKVKMFLSFSSISVFLVLVGVACYLTLDGIVKNFHHITDVNFASVEPVMKMLDHSDEVRTHLRNLRDPSKVKVEEEIKNLEEAMGEFENGNVVDIEFIALDKEQQEVERAFKLR